MNAADSVGIYQNEGLLKSVGSALQTSVLGKGESDLYQWETGRK